MSFGRLLAAFTAFVGVALPASTALAHPVTVDGVATDWSSRIANGDNLGLVARDAMQFGEYSWRDNAADTRTDLATPETVSDLTRVQITGSPAGLSFLVTLSISGGVPVNPVQVQIAIDRDQVSGSGQTFFAGFADTSVAPAAAWEYLVQTQLTVGPQAVVRDTTFATVGAPVPVSSGAGLGSPPVLEFTVPWSQLGLSGPPSTPLRFTIATFREQSGGDTVDIGGPTNPNALDAVSDYGAPDATAPYPNTFGEFNLTSAPPDLTVNYNFDVWFGTTGEVYSPLQVIRYVSSATNDTVVGGEWIALRNMTPAPLLLDGFRLGDEETAANTGEAMLSLPVVTLPAGGVFIAAQSGTNYLARFGVRPDAQWSTPADATTTSLAAYTPWSTGTGGIALANAGDEIFVIDRSHTATEIVVYGSGIYAGVTNMSAPGTGAAGVRNAAGIDRDDCAMDFTTAATLCANDAACTTCGECLVNTCLPRATGFVCRAAASGGCDTAETCNGTTTACPTDGFAAATTVCRAAVAGGCDVPETCTGTSAACPADSVAPVTTVCRAAAAGGCDVPENCDGTTPVCPSDGFAANTIECRPAIAGGCDVAERCSGSSAACPADVVVTAGTECRPAGAGGCDVAEACTGASASCPVDGFAPATTMCRPAVGGCDVAENCSGAAAACPVDTFASTGTPCPDTSRCNGDETCNGAGVCGAGTPVTCPASGMPCMVNTCNDTTGACGLLAAPAGTSCSDGNACNGDEVCGASGACVPGTAPVDAGPACVDAGVDAGVDASADAAIDAVTLDTPASDAVTMDTMGTDVVTTDTTGTDAARDVATDARVDGAARDAGGDAAMVNPQAPGCGCRTAGSDRSSRHGWAPYAALALAALFASRRRRTHR